MSRHLFGSLAVATVLLCHAGASRAQTIFDPPSEPGPYVHQATLTPGGAATDDEFGRRVALSGDIALVSGTGLVYVFERDGGSGTWEEVAPLRPEETREGFGRALAIDGNTAIVGSQGAAHVFRRARRGVWREIATLLPSQGHADFGRSVGIAGNQAIVGAVEDPDSSEVGAAYIFRRRSANSRNWREVAILSSPGTSQLGRRTFGFGVAISGDAAIVSEALGPNAGAANIFVRQDAPGDQWRHVRRHQIGGFTHLGGVDLERRTAVLGGGEIQAFALIFDRDAGGPDAWGLEAFYGTPEDVACCGTFNSVNISGDRIVLGLSGIGSGVEIAARNQGGPNAWGRIARFRDPAALTPRALGLGASVAIDGDTALLGAPGRFTSPPDGNAVFVVVSDLDGDGLRDAIDPCERDPLNDVAGGCQRSSGSHAVVDHLVTQGTVTTDTRGQRFVIDATFTNTSQTAIRNPFFEVTELTGNNVLIGADAGMGGIGATLSPDVGDGVLSPGESTRVTFRIGLATRDPFVFLVTLHGDPAP